MRLESRDVPRSGRAGGRAVRLTPTYPPSRQGISLLRFGYRRLDPLACLGTDSDPAGTHNTIACPPPHNGRSPQQGRPGRVMVAVYYKEELRL